MRLGALRRSAAVEVEDTLRVLERCSKTVEIRFRIAECDRTSFHQLVEVAGHLECVPDDVMIRVRKS